MTMQAPSFFTSMIPSTATPVVVQPAGSFESPLPSAPQVHRPSSSVSASPLLSSSFVAMSPRSTVADDITTSGGARHNLAVGDFYRSSSTATLAPWHSVIANDSCGSGGAISGSGLHPPMPTCGLMTSKSAAFSSFSAGSAGMASYGSSVGLQSLFGAGCSGSSSSSFAGALHHASETTLAAVVDPPQPTSGHLMATGNMAGGGRSAALAHESAYFSAFGTSTSLTPVGSGGLYPLASQPDTLQAMIYRRSFTGAKPPYSYISLITMAIQVN